MLLIASKSGRLAAAWAKHMFSIFPRTKLLMFPPAELMASSGSEVGVVAGTQAQDKQVRINSIIICNEAGQCTKYYIICFPTTCSVFNVPGYIRLPFAYDCMALY